MELILLLNFFSFFLIIKKKPILLMGHTRALTRVKFNHEGDLLFSISKDNQPCVWYSSNGEKLGTFDGHNGTVWSLDISFNSELLLTGSADNSMRLWSVKDGREIYKWNTKSAVRSCKFAEGDKKILFVTDATMGQTSTIHIVPVETPQTQRVLSEIVIKGSKATQAVWGNLNKTIITGHDDGTVTIWDAKVFYSN